jgi:mRNA-degrading endonuclease RelE of RelBE toxin-antitoxin system
LKRIRFSDQAKSDIRAIPQSLAMNILSAIHHLAETGAGSVKRLQGIEPPEFRLRVGDFRVRFSEEPSGTIRIHGVKNRKDAYRD